MPLTSKQRVRAALAGEMVDRPPFIPLLGTVVSRYMQIPERELYSSATRLANSLQACQRLFRYDAVSNPVDPVLEVEACEGWDSGEVPPLEKRGRIPIVREVLERLNKIVGRDTAVIATVSGPFALARRLAGEEGWLRNGEQRAVWAHRSAAAVLRLCKTYMELQVDGILLIDPELPVQDASLFASVQESLDTIVNLTQFYDSRLFLSAPGVQAESLGDVLSLGATAFAFGSTVPFKVLCDEAVHRGVGFAGSIADGLLLENGDQLKECVRQMVEAGGKRGFFITTEGEVPASTPAVSLHSIVRVLDSL